VNSDFPEAKETRQRASPRAEQRLAWNVMSAQKSRKSPRRVDVFRRPKRCHISASRHAPAHACLVKLLFVFNVEKSFSPPSRGEQARRAPSELTCSFERAPRCPLPPAPSIERAPHAADCLIQFQIYPKVIFRRSASSAATKWLRLSASVSLFVASRASTIRRRRRNL
jgi:hypothetical protein